jgi:hypothetical protein
VASQNKTPFLTPTDVRTAFEEAYKWHRSTYFEPVEEFERLARNKPSLKIDPALPKITSGDLAAIIQEGPKSVIQQLATGLVTSSDYPEFAPIADVVHRTRLLPLYHNMGTALQKHWSMMSQAKTYGRSTSYTFFTSTEGRLHTDFVIPYVKDVLGEKGKVYAPDSNVAFMRTWYQKRDLQAIINKENSLKEKNKNYESGWNLKLLSQFMNEGGSAKPGDLQTPAEREKGDGMTGGYEVIHVFQKGIGAEQYAFSPRFKDGANLRTKVGKDPRGALPLDFEYCNIDLSNPLGRGDVELGGGLQNLIDQQLQMYMFMSTYMQQPALKVQGNVNKASLKIRPNALWDMGTGPNNSVERDEVDNVYINNFVQNMQFLQAKLHALLGSSSNDIPASVGNVGQSKTHAGVQANQQQMNVMQNYAEKQHEAWYQAQSETSLNIFFAEMSGEETIDIGKQDVKSLRGTPAEKYIDKDGEKLTIPYGKISDCTFKFIVDPASSKAEDDVDQLTKLKELNDEINANPLVINWFLGQDGKKLNSGEMLRQRIQRMGLKNIDMILTDMSPEEAQQAAQAPFPIVDKPQFRVNTADLTAEQIQAVLALGGVSQQPGVPSQGMPAGLSPQGQADFIVEMTKAQAAAQAKQPTAAPDKGLTPEELAIKQTEFDQNQQKIDLEKQKHETDTVLKADKQAHDTQLAIVQHGQSAMQAAQSHELASESAKQAAVAAKKKPVGAAK